MLQVEKEEPEFFSKTVKSVQTPKESKAWEELREIRADLRKHILEDEQSKMCAYCEKKITADKEKSNIDHFKTRNLFPDLTLDYNNLFVSCNSLTHCSTIKDSSHITKEDYENIFTPLTENLKESFSFAIAGDIIGNNEKAEFTIEKLGLNSTALIEQRKKIAHYILNNYKEFDSETIFLCLGEHINLINYMKNNPYD